ncbi:maleylpyruvate isomerase family mycothiol-dependent enzyme [Streptomyces sp. NBRC 109706]|uniref:maleylpyruvate isomerase family mycothiol-dependent enzyme n=1 Tax=Streptomyces sp. NBRC 109706 TaxID=1550035 RepID=UPI000781225C|nr:maleylpyruvate isomerase family mycothiol-dependent enzyme [Streptomyces sp. NBRC 109706]
MESALLLHHLHTGLTAFRACLDGDLSAPVAHCGDWTLLDLAEHLGSENIWAATAVTEGHGDGGGGGPAPRERAALIRWFEDTSRTLRTALDTDPAAEAWTFHPPRTVGFWQRRRALETLVHRWDAESALGAARPLDPELAGEGVAEVFDTMAPRQVARGRARPPRQALRLTATDTGASWVHGAGVPAATISAPAEQLLLLLWGRIPTTSPALHWAGDRETALAVLAGPLTP